MSLTTIMWYHAQSSAIFPGQSIGPTIRPEANRTDHMKLSPSTDISDGEFLVEPSRKRKAVDMNQGCNNTSDELALGSWPRESNSQLKASAFSEMDLGPFSNKSPKHSEPNIKVPVFGGKYQFHSLNSFSVYSQINDGNFPKPPVDKMNHSSLQLHSFNPKEPLPLIKCPVATSSSLPDSLPLSYHMSYQIEAHRYLSYSDPSIACLEKDGPGLNDGLNFGLKFNTLPHDSSMQSKPSERLGSLEASNLKHQLTQYGNLCRITSIQDGCNTGSLVEVKDHNQTLDVAGSRDISNVEARTSNDQPYENCNLEVRTSTPLDNGVVSSLEGRNLNQWDHDIQIMLETEGLGLESMKHSLGKEASPNNDKMSTETLVGQGHGDSSWHGAHDLDGKSTSFAGKIASTTVDKLWDGSLQLSASVTVSAVAFFKSGEKAPKINWSKSIEVKGKVRLEAFEKYIQELPRSRSRALMVISLCWKVGSSETGFKGMKEVAKGYKEREKVGFAQLSPGLDIYVCPRSDTIITILAKYGFFKGMAAVEDDQDSLIGCVVWRRKPASFDSVSKRGEKNSPSMLEQPLNLPSDTDIQRNTVGNTPLSQTNAGSSRPLCSETVTAALERSESFGIGNKATNYSNTQLEAGNSFTNVNSNPIPLVSADSSAIPLVCQTAVCSDSTLKVPSPHMCGSGSEKYDGGLELPTAFAPIPSQEMKPLNKPAFYDEDLPEFDFNAACGVLHGSVRKPLFSGNRVHVSNALPLEMNVGASIPSALPIIHPISGGFLFERNQEKLAPKLREDDPPRLVLPLPEKAEFYSSKLSIQSGIVKPLLKLRWDDDDMPEWCPPHLEHRRHHPAVSASMHSVPYCPSTVRNSEFEKVKFLPPLPMSIHPSLRAEGLPPTPPLPIHPSLQLGGLPPPPPMSIHPSLQPVGFAPPLPMSIHPSLQPEGVPPQTPMSIHPSLNPEGLPPPPPVPIQAQGLLHGYQHYPATMNPTQTGPVGGGYTQFSSTSSVDINSNPTLRPQSSINTCDVRPSIYRPAGWRGWRP